MPPPPEPLRRCLVGARTLMAVLKALSCASAAPPPPFARTLKMRWPKLRRRGTPLSPTTAMQVAAETAAVVGAQAAERTAAPGARGWRRTSVGKGGNWSNAVGN